MENKTKKGLFLISFVLLWLTFVVASPGSNITEVEGSNLSINLISPPNATIVESKTIEFVYNPEGPVSLDIAMCELLINGNVRANDTEVEKFQNNNFIQTLGPGTHEWKILCIDELGLNAVSPTWQVLVPENEVRIENLPFLLIETCDYLDILINITEEGKEAYGAEFALYFNPSLITVANVTPGDFLTQGGIDLLVHLDINNEEGRIIWGATRQMTDTGVRGFGTLARIYIKGEELVMPPGTNFDLQEVAVSTSFGKRIYTIVEDDCSLIVWYLPGDVNWDRIVNIFDLAIIGKAYWSEVGDPLYDWKADINQDGRIDLFDLVWVGKHYWINYEKKCTIL